MSPGLVRGGSSVASMASAPVRAASRLAATLRPDAVFLPAWERTALDDVAARRPWNLRVKWARRRALPRLRSLAEGVTVVIVNWNTKDVTSDVIRAVQLLSAPDVRVLVVDNGSRDGSREMLSAWPGISTMLLRSNAGHGVALDLGICSVRTRISVTLDSDAIPLTSEWLEPATTPVREGRAVLTGLRARRGFVHPVYAAVDTASFVRRNLSFQTHVPPRAPGVDASWGENAWDTGELLTRRLSPGEVSFVERSPNLVDDLPGMTAGGVVYHHGGVSRAANGAPAPHALEQWSIACARLQEAVAMTTTSEHDRS